MYLDGKTGTHSIYTEYLGYELMFHVSTLLPFSSLNAQQVSFNLFFFFFNKILITFKNSWKGKDTLEMTS